MTSDKGWGTGPSVIVVEDDTAFCAEVAAFLTERGMDVRRAGEGGSLWRQLGERCPDAVVLDLGLPGEDGVAIAAELRRRDPALGIVMMTARTGVQDRIIGYETGADVYLVKPVHLGELVAAIRATLRHRAPDGADGPAAIDPMAERWTLDLTAWRLSAPGGGAVQLTRAEVQVLECLTRVPGQAVSRADIGVHMGKARDLTDHRAIDQVIRRLRRKIESQLDLQAPLGSAHACGYYFMCAVIRKEG